MDERAQGRDRLALCLSGGGYRASLFHLGALRRLNELGVLSKVHTISAVSGGSITAAFLAERVHPWPQPGATIEDWDDVVAKPFYSLTANNIRTGPLLRRYLLPWNWRNVEASINALIEHYRNHLTDRKLGDLPDRPQFLFCATEMVVGRYWVARKPQSDHPGGAILKNDTFYAPSDWSVARAVGASTCFPPMFGPLAVEWSPKKVSGTTMQPHDLPSVDALHLIDGGIFDNTGLAAVWEDYEKGTVLVSSGGKTFDSGWRNNLLWRVMRMTSILDYRSGVTLKRLLMQSFAERQRRGAYWGIDASRMEYDENSGGYSASLVADIVANIRTDLDAFTAAEKAVLENHGYLTCEGAIRSHIPELVERDAPVRIPYPEWMDEDRVRRELKGSRQRKVLGRGWPWSGFRVERAAPWSG